MDHDMLIKEHAQVTRLDQHELVRQLNSHLGPTLVALLANVRDRKLPHKWAAADGPAPRTESYTRLQAAHRAWSLICAADDEYVARQWFIGANPRLDEDTPVMRLRAGDIKSVIAAATAFSEGSNH